MTSECGKWKLWCRAGVGDGIGEAFAAPPHQIKINIKIRENIFSGKYHVKFGHFVLIFHTYICGQKCLASKVDWAPMPMMQRRGQSVNRMISCGMEQRAEEWRMKAWTLSEFSIVRRPACSVCTAQSCKFEPDAPLSQHRVTGRHPPYGITQCYLPPDTSERPPP